MREEVVNSRPPHTRLSTEAPPTNPARNWREVMGELSRQYPLRVDAVLESGIAWVRDNTCIFVTGDPGVGKSSRFLEALYLADMMLIVSQPGVLTTVRAAKRAASDLGCEIGDVVGYRTGNYRDYQQESGIQFMTAGYMARWLLAGGLDEFKRAAYEAKREPVIVIDEIHAGDADSEFTLAWIKYLNVVRGAGIKLVVMSATMDIERLKEYLNTPAGVEIPGVQHKITKVAPTRPFQEEILFQANAGNNVLAFCSGKPVIEKTTDYLLKAGVNADIIPLHGELSLYENERALKVYSDPNERAKIVLSTNAGESSLTYTDIHVVIISGEKRVMLIDEHGRRSLITQSTPASERKQQGGRVGRVQAGTVIEYGEADRPFAATEIECTPPFDQVLLFTAMGVDVAKLSFLHSTGAQEKARTAPLLRRFGLIDANGSATERGSEIARYPTSFRAGCMLAFALKHGNLEATIDAVSIFEADGIVEHGQDDWKSLIGDESRSDILAQCGVLRAILPYIGPSITAKLLHQEDRNDFKELADLCSTFSLKQSNLIRALRMRDRLRKDFKIGKADRSISLSDHRSADAELGTATLKAIAAGLYDFRFRLAEGSNGTVSALHNGEKRALGLHSVLRGEGREQETFLVGYPLNITTVDGDGKEEVKKLLPLASKFELLWLKDIAPELVSYRDGDATYSPTYDCVMGCREAVVDGIGVRDLDAEERKFIKIEDSDRAADIFATWMADMVMGMGGHAKIAKYPALVAVVERNRRFVKRKLMSREDVVATLKTALNGATCIQEIPSYEDLKL